MRYFLLHFIKSKGLLHANYAGEFEGFPNNEEFTTVMAKNLECKPGEIIIKNIQELTEKDYLNFIKTKL